MGFDSRGVLITPGLDSSRLTDEEIQNKIQEIDKRLLFITNTYGFASQMIPQLQDIKNILQSEAYERYARERGETMKANKNDIIESEPDLIADKHKRDQQKPVAVTHGKKSMPTIIKNWVNGNKGNK